MPHGPTVVLWGMFGIPSKRSDALNDLVRVVEEISVILGRVLHNLDEQGPLEGRVADLERSRSQWEAEVEAEWTRAESKFKAARSAEERTRSMETHAKALAGSEDGEDGITEEYRELVRLNAEAGADEALHLVPASVAITPKARALQAKFGRVS